MKWQGRTLCLVTFCFAVALLAGQGRARGQAPVEVRGSPIADLEGRVAALEERVAALEEGHGGAARMPLSRTVYPGSDGDVIADYSIDYGAGYLGVFRDHYARFAVADLSIEDAPLIQAHYKPTFDALRSQQASAYELPSGAWAVAGAAGNPQVVVAREGEVLVLYKRNYAYMSPQGEVVNQETLLFVAPEADGSVRLTVTLVQ